MSSTQERFHRYDRWIQARSGRVLDLLRIYLGFALFARGWFYIMNVERLVGAGWFDDGVLSLGASLAAHYVAIAHIAGGLMLAVGFLTRLAALVQIPVLLGAIFFVHWGGGVMSLSGSFELAALVLVLLVLFAVYGGGRWSVDELVFRRDPTGDRDVQRDAERHRHGIREPLGSPT